MVIKHRNLIDLLNGINVTSPKMPPTSYSVAIKSAFSSPIYFPDIARGHVGLVCACMGGRINAYIE